jgi:hypothetical protein
MSNPARRMLFNEPHLTPNLFCKQCTLFAKRQFSMVLDTRAPVLGSEVFRNCAEVQLSASLHITLFAIINNACAGG